MQWKQVFDGSMKTVKYNARRKTVSFLDLACKLLCHFKMSEMMSVKKAYSSQIHFTGVYSS